MIVVLNRETQRKVAVANKHSYFLIFDIENMSVLQNLMKEVDALRDQLETLKPLKAADEERLWKKFRLEWNYNSNHLEGNTLTYGQTELLLIFDKTTGDHEMREYEEMKAHDVALKMVVDYAKDNSRELTEADIREFNKRILVQPFWGNAQTRDGQPTRKLIQPGEYKKEPNSVRLQNGEMFHYASPEETPAKMNELVDWLRNASAEKRLHPLQIAAQLHYDFVRIHPFDDCNGRTSRLLMNYVLMRNGYPPAIIKSADKKNYLNALNKADVGELDSFIQYVGEQLVWSISIAIKAFKGESIEEVDDVKKEISVITKRLDAGHPKSKHPAIIYETYKVFSKNVWDDLRNRIKEFDKLFPERKEFYFVNHSPESYEKRNMREDPFVKSTGPTKLKIFGHDIYDDDIKIIEWRMILYGLRGASKKPNIELESQLIFDIDKYHFKLLIESKIFFESIFDYGNFINDADAMNALSVLIKGILDEIKLRTHETF